MPAKKSGPKPRYTPEEIVDAALDLLDAEGLSRFNLRGLAVRLGLTPMAIYRFFADKEMLLAAMAARAFPETHLRLGDDVDWQQKLKDLLWSLFDALQIHPAALELILARVEAEGQFDWLREQLVKALRGAGFDADTIVLAISMLISNLFGTVALENFRRRRGYSVELDRERHLPPSAFPQLTALAQEQAVWDARAAFEFALERNVASLDELLRDRGRGGRS